jgi:hypothetical protein
MASSEDAAAAAAGCARACGVVPGAYLDSVRLMALAGKLEAQPGVQRAWLAMATEGSLEARARR